MIWPLERATKPVNIYQFDSSIRTAYWLDRYSAFNRPSFTWLFHLKPFFPREISANQAGPVDKGIKPGFLFSSKELGRRHGITFKGWKPDLFFDEIEMSVKKIISIGKEGTGNSKIFFRIER